MYPTVEDLLKTADYITNEIEIEIIRKAFEVSQKSHEGHLRKSGEPYFIHCVATAINIANQGMDYETISAGLLHDTLEDTSYTEQEMLRDFGPNITKLVDGVTKLGKVKYSGAERHVESLRKFFIAMSDDIRVVIIKLCDRLHNIQTLEHVDEKKRKRIALETIEIHARLADRLGMGKLKSALEDGAFKYVYPNEYKKTIEVLGSVKSNNEEALAKVAKSLSEELKILDVNIERVDHRVKHLYSLWQKLKKHDYDINKIYDVIALRIIVPSISDCYQALGVIHGLYKPIQGRFKDYIAVPKPNGYKSLHTSVFTGGGEIVEIQIRTQVMHEEAEFGIASHLSYKGDKSTVVNKGVDEKVQWTQELMQWQKNETANKDFLSELKEDFFNHRVFVFTPKGDVIDLPEGSTPIDFAYHIHSDIGDHSQRAYANSKLVPFDYKLRNHDIMNIEVADSAKPNRKWINSCKTQLAKRHIRSWLKTHGGFVDRLLVRS